jgi:TrmH family RNA methyltransferase
MLIKSKVKYIQSLSHKKQRDEDGIFVAEGPKIINELLAAEGVQLVELYAVKEIIGSLPEALHSKIIETDPQELHKISFLSTPNQVLGLFKKPVVMDLDLKDKVTLMLDNIQDPGNLGSIVRCADWFGITQIICSRDCADVFGPKTVQSTMGSIIRVNVVYDDLPGLLARWPEIGVYAATLAGKNVYDQARLKEGIIVIGNESRGISKEVLDRVSNTVTIPRRGQAESLNAAVAAGIILSHLVG